MLSAMIIHFADFERLSFTRSLRLATMVAEEGWDLKDTCGELRSPSHRHFLLLGLNELTRDVLKLPSDSQQDLSSAP